MTLRDELDEELRGVPEPLLGEVVHFVRHLRARATGERMESALAAESALRKDWLRPEEDDAWRDL